MKALAFINCFFGLPEQGKFVTEPVRGNLIKYVIPERFTCNSLLFKVLNISTGWKPWLVSSIA